MVFFFGPIGKKQDGRPASDWLRHFRLVWNRCTEFNETWQEARSQRPLPSLCFLAHLSRRLEWAIVIAHRPSSVRKLFTFSTSSPEPLDGFWWNLVGMKYSWSLTSVVVFRPDPPRGGAKIGHRGSPSSRNFFFRPEGYSDKPNA